MAARASLLRATASILPTCRWRMVSAAWGGARRYVAGDAGAVASNPTPTPSEEKKDKKTGWGMFLVYVASGISGVVWLYYFYKARYSFHQTEILLLDAFSRLPLYYPPDSSESEAVMNSSTDSSGLPEDLKMAFCEWFVVTDLEEPDGVTRDDVLELMGELGLNEDAQPAKDFLYRGAGHIEERRRLSCVGLQESLTLYASLTAESAKQQTKEPTEGAPALALPKSGAEQLEVLRRKFRRSQSALTGAEVLRQAMASPIGPAAANLDSPTTPAPERPAAVAPEAAAAPLRAPEEDPGELDEDEELRFEDVRLARLEAELLGRLERHGNLSPAEESRLADVRQKRTAIKSQAP
eukprot:TRINITY_DN78805_c0_g1_i1.p1 TRINITY_DN78805_c0_g1~~TRINITY_DN78805_c0_g1_i1.p1  ORF type:complete len:381 (-),score=83.99 TRINITY_DN78805_c0_g1_i1:60-1115(-)